MLCEYEAAAAAADSPRSALCRAAEAALPDAAAARELRGMLRQHCLARRPRASRRRPSANRSRCPSFGASSRASTRSGRGGARPRPRRPRRRKRRSPPRPPPPPPTAAMGVVARRRRRGPSRPRRVGGARRRGRHRDPNGVGGGRGVARGAPLPCVRCARRGHADARAGRGRPLSRLFP